MSNWEEMREKSGKPKRDGQWNEQEFKALIRLRRKYQRNTDDDTSPFSTEERVRLTFIKWLTRTGRINP